MEKAAPMKDRLEDYLKELHGAGVLRGGVRTGIP